MTKQEKFLLLVVLVVSGVGATLYVQNNKEVTAAKEQVQQVEVQNVAPVTNVTEAGAPAEQTTASTNTTTGSTATNTTTSKQTVASYNVPNGDTENLSVTVKLTNGVISDISFAMTPTNRESAEYYNKFKSSFQKSTVVGKTLSGVSLSRVGGASLTTNAFNKAIGQLRG